uniref:protein-glutamate methylesterase n=1 Tax=Roseihalotalea indica TaxID=2867963 RepID=A0AA49JJ76_9BACT|nr:chemotaxis protein CheB [Tunicatimonas sp. TK19036]
MNLKYPSSFPVFLIGTSGTGLRALRFLAEHIPSSFPSPLFFLLHRVKGSELQRSILNVINTYSQLEVCVPQDGQEVQPSTIYVPPVDEHLILEGKTMILTKEPADTRWRPSIDTLLISGARSYRTAAVSVLLSGGLDDGIEGLREITRQGGVTIAQSPDDAYNPVLPLNALLKDHPSYVLPLNDMPALFCELAGHNYFPDQSSIIQKAALTAARKRKEVQEK